MASTTVIYNSARKYMWDGTVDLDTDTIKVMLLLDTYTADAAGHTLLSDVSAHQVAAGNGYTAGGLALANKAITYSGTTAKFTADNPVWAGLTKTFRHALIYAEKTVAAVVNPLLCCILLDNTPANIVVSSADYSIQWHANGIFTLSSAA